jgi:hypothetical protein
VISWAVLYTIDERYVVLLFCITNLPHVEKAIDSITVGLDSCKISIKVAFRGS